MGNSIETAVSVESVAQLLEQQNYIADVGLSTSLFLSLKMGKAIFLEGEPKVGKLEIDKSGRCRCPRPQLM